MWGHLSNGELVDNLLGSVAARAESHLTSCARCQGRLEELRQGLRSAREPEVPEPSPLYWEAFRRQVDERLDTRPAAWSFGLRPVLATAAALVALVSFVPSYQPRPPAERSLPAWSALPPVADDAGFSMLQGLASSEDEWLAATHQPGVVGLVSGLSESERQALAEALRAELSRSGS
jgi:hypothetical protein